MSRSHKPLTPLEQLRTLCDALSDNTLRDKTRLTKGEREKAGRLRTKLIQFVEDHEARLDAEAAGIPEWTKRAVKKERKIDGYTM